MTSYAFTPSASTLFQFQPTFDGATYNAIITWNLFRQDWYVNVFDLSNNLIVSLPVIGSPTSINLQAISWANGRVTCAVVSPHGFPVGATVRLTIAGCFPDAYNGLVDVLVSGANTFTYALASDPGDATVLGTAGYSINMLDGYFTSTLIFREASSTFEVSP